MFATADLIDEFETELQSCAIQFANFGGRRIFSGQVQTIACQEDNALVKSVLAEAGAGRVLVIDAGGSFRTAIVGDVLAALGAKNQWGGIIINGAVRDCARLSQVDIGVKALGTNPARSGKAGTGRCGVSLSLGGARFEPGNWVYCDDDGVVVAKRQLCEEITQ